MNNCITYLFIIFMVIFGGFSSALEVCTVHNNRTGNDNYWRTGGSLQF